VMGDEILALADELRELATSIRPRPVRD
jgi:hypothetical protein